MKTMVKSKNKMMIHRKSKIQIPNTAKKRTKMRTKKSLREEKMRFRQPR